MTDHVPPPSDDDAPPDYPRPRLVRDEPRRGTNVIMIDQTLERALIAAITNHGTTPYVAATEAGANAAVFTDPQMGLLWQTFDRIVAAGKNIDPPTIVSVATANGLPINMTAADLYEFGTQEGVKKANAGQYAATLVDYAVKRDLYEDALALSNGKFVNLRAEIDKLAAKWDAAHGDTTVAFFEDMEAAMNGDTMGEPPTVGMRSDGACALLYAGKFNNVIGESESMKSFLVQWFCVEQIAAGNHVIFLDFEKDAQSVAERLLSMGATPEQIVGRFHYRRREDPWRPDELARLREQVDQYKPTLCVIDGVTNAMTLEGLEPNTNSDVSKFYGGVPLILTKSGAAVVAIDHLTKARDARMPGAIGGQHKRAGIDGVSLKMVLQVPGGRGRTGKGGLVIDKDAPGYLRPNAVNGEHIADVVFHSDGESMTVHVDPSSKTEAKASPTTGQVRLTGFMERVSRVLEAFDTPQSSRTICRNVKGTDTHILSALRTLVDEGFATVVRKGAANLYQSKRAYREDLDKQSGVAPAISDEDDLFPSVDDDWDDQPY